MSKTLATVKTHLWSYIRKGKEKVAWFMIGPIDLLDQTNPSNTFVYLATSWTKERKPLNGVFSTSNSYKTKCQTVRSPSKPTLLSPEALQKWH